MQKVFTLLLLCLALTTTTFAQKINVKGEIKSATDNSPVIGANVMVKGTTNGTVSDINGAYTIAVSANETLVFSSIGYEAQEIIVAGQTVINVILKESTQNLDEVVITALGFERRTKTLGYSVQEVKGEELTQARESNIINALNGKVAGVTIVGTPSGVGSSARVTIRGERSLNINKNQPLYVIDGIPIGDTYVGSSGRSNQEADYGNPAGMINPDDVESMTVLKGANASALYGSRAANGVIVITTKSGTKNKTMGVSISSTSMFESVLRLPDYQNKYGQGLNGEFSFLDGKGGGLRDGVDENWGPEFKGQLIPQFDSPRSVAGFRGGDVKSPGAAGSKITPTIWDANPDNIKNFFETGHLISNSISLDGGNENGSYRLSYTNTDEKGTMPNTKLTRNYISFNGSYKLSRKLSSKVTFNYINQNSPNRANLSYGTENVMYLLNCWLDRGTDLEPLKDYWQKGLESKQQYNFNYNYHDNPYFQLYENTNSQKLSRVFGNLVVKYDFTDWMYLQLRAGNDYSNDTRERKRAYSTMRFPFGAYRVEKISTQEFNSDAILGLNKAITANWNFNLTLGASVNNSNYNYLDVMAPQLLVPGVYSLNNSKVALSYLQINTEKEIRSLFGSAQFSFKDYWFIDITSRNDWSSTLHPDNNSYYYPSVSTSLVVSDMVKLPEWFTYAKGRLSWAQVGNDTDPQNLYQVHNAAGSFGEYYTYSEEAVLKNPKIKPEKTTSNEFGLDVKFLQNRIGLSLTYYNTVTKNQIIYPQTTISTGYSSAIVNAGEIRNNGLEVALNVIPLKIKDFEWNIDINWSKNNSEVVSLYNNMKNYVQASKYVSVEARVGGRIGDMYGYGFQRNPNGEIIYASNGRPKQSTNTMLLGNYNPDWLAGVNNSFRYKNINLNVLFDIRQGGEVYSHTMVVGREGGQLVETLEGRANGYDLNLEGNGVIGKGVVEVKDVNGTVTGYAPNTTKLSSREWHTAYTNGRSLLEGAIFDASYVKLREVKLGYTIPNKLFGKLPFRDVNISLVGRNLYLWTDVPHIDPETSGLSGGTIIPGVEAMSIPSSRSIGFSVNLKF